VEINAEMGLLIDCAALTEPFAEVLEERIATAAWRVLEEDGRLVWRGRVHGEEVVETKEPQASTWLRFKAWFLKIVPDRQL
jgi:putative cardiolipin synthase